MIRLRDLCLLAGALSAVALPCQAAAPTPTSAPATAPSTAPASAPATARRPSVAEMLASRSPANLDLEEAELPKLLTAIARAYDIQIVNNYELKGFVTLKVERMTPRQAINTLNGTILPLGYTVVESVRGDPPGVVLTVVPTRLDAGRYTPVYTGNDPEQIPEGEAQRTQIMTYKAVDPEKARTMIAAVVGKQAIINVNPSTRTITITDTGTHVRAAAGLLRELERQAVENK